ncbi:lipase family protein [Streptomyces sp. NBC_00656]|uniref:esterase/lipase family protein n=1 Tax=Streptomyces sp. NBC_00656 TaxID=2903668 RepID=UPI00324648A5
MNTNWRTPRLLRTTWTTCVALAAACAMSLLGTVPSASAAAEPALVTPAATLDAALHCPSTFTHPDREPVLMVHGFTSTFAETWNWSFGPALRADGYDVCGLDLPRRSTGDVQESSEYVVRAIDRIKAATGRKVDVVAHSEGNMQTRWALKWWPHLQNDVDDYVSLAGPNHGVPIAVVGCVIPCVPAAHQFATGSAFLGALNQGDETPGPVSYTSIYSATDEAVLPYTTSRLSGAKNILLQSICPAGVVTHVGLVYDSVSYRLTRDALSHPGTADAGRLPFGKCLEAFAPGVSAPEVAVASAVILANAVPQLFNDPTWNEPALKPYALG